MLINDGQFVLLEHTRDGSRHWDFMLEAGQVLATWQWPNDPTVRLAPDRPGASLDGQRIQDHRLAYLDYQGKISGQRGHVRRLDRGRYSLIHESDTLIEFALIGQLLRGHFRLTVLDTAEQTCRLERI